MKRLLLLVTMAAALLAVPSAIAAQSVTLVQPGPYAIGSQVSVTYVAPAKSLDIFVWLTCIQGTDKTQVLWVGLHSVDTFGNLIYSGTTPLWTLDSPTWNHSLPAICEAQLRVLDNSHKWKTAATAFVSLPAQ